tara:strand:+ start:3031 stop:3201 length:171 start_codon:yes stop_codon:yes gene_type:complete
MTIVEFGSFRIASLKLALISDNEFAVADGFQYWLELFASSELPLSPASLEVPLEVT